MPAIRTKLLTLNRVPVIKPVIRGAVVRVIVIITICTCSKVSPYCRICDKRDLISVLIMSHIQVLLQPELRPYLDNIRSFPVIIGQSFTNIADSVTICILPVWILQGRTIIQSVCDTIVVRITGTGKVEINPNHTKNNKQVFITQVFGWGKRHLLRIP